MSLLEDAWWLPPDESYYHFTNCTTASSWAAARQLTSDIPTIDTAILIYEGLQVYWQSENITVPSYGEVVGWVVDDHATEDRVLTTPIFAQVDEYIISECRVDYCKKLPWQGNSDLSGRGMLSSYFLQAGLVTLYMIFVGLGRLNKSAHLFKSGTKLERCLVAFQESTRTFLNASALFCIAMLVATIYVFGSAMADSTTMITSYVQYSSAFISFFTIFPTLVLHSCATNQLRRETFRLYVWGLTACLTITIAGLFFYIPSSAVFAVLANHAATLEDQQLSSSIYAFLASLKDPETQLHWEMICVQDGIVLSFHIVIIVTISLLAAFVAFYLLIIENITRVPFLRSEKRPWLKSFRKQWWWITALTSFSGMWATLALFVYYRNQFNKLSGDLNKDEQWSLGQVLALAAWVPVIIELGFIAKKGAIDALTGQLSKKYKVVLADSLHGSHMHHSHTSDKEANVSYHPIMVQSKK